MEGPALSTMENAKTLQRLRQGNVGGARGFMPTQSQGAQAQKAGGPQTAQQAGGKRVPKNAGGKGVQPSLQIVIGTGGSNSAHGLLAFSTASQTLHLN